MNRFFCTEFWPIYTLCEWCLKAYESEIHKRIYVSCKLFVNIYRAECDNWKKLNYFIKVYYFYY